MLVNPELLANQLIQTRSDQIWNQMRSKKKVDALTPKSPPTFEESTSESTFLASVRKKKGEKKNREKSFEKKGPQKRFQKKSSNKNVRKKFHLSRDPK